MRRPLFAAHTYTGSGVADSLPLRAFCSLSLSLQARRLQDMCLMMAQKGQVQSQITDGYMKQMLEGISEGVCTALKPRPGSPYRMAADPPCRAPPPPRAPLAIPSTGLGSRSQVYGHL